MKFELHARADSEEAKIIQKELREHNARTICPDTFQELVIALKDDKGNVIGGLVGNTNWGWLYTRLLWVSDDLRGEGYGTKILEMAEAEAMKRGCKYAWIDTFSEKARALYQRQGYQDFGRLEDFPPSHTRYFLKKSLRE